MSYPVILSFDVGVIHLSYCLLTKKEFMKEDGTKYIDWFIIDWNNIDLTNRNLQKCACGKNPSLINVINGETKYYCKNHSKTLDLEPQEFDKCFTNIDKTINKCSHLIKNNPCNKNAGFSRNNCCYCNTHAKQLHKSINNSLKLKPYKMKSSTSLVFDDVKYSLMMELEKRVNLLSADYVVIENQPSFKNPRMKSIASTIYDYYLIRGIIDKNITKSKITHVKFMSPSNKLKLADEEDTKELIKVKNTDDETKTYKLTKALGIKYTLSLTKHLPNWITHFNSFKKKDDLADSFLQGVYFYQTLKL